MALKARFALLPLIVCTAYTSLHRSWTSVDTSQWPVCTSQMSLSVCLYQSWVCGSQKSTPLWYLSVCTRDILHAENSFICCENIREFQKVKFSVKIFQCFWIKITFFQKFSNSEVVLHLLAFSVAFLWNLENGVYLIKVQILPKMVEFTGYLLFSCFNCNNH